MTSFLPHRRILVIDDNIAIHDDFRKILGVRESDEAALEAAEAKLFGAPEVAAYHIDTATQGEDGFTLVKEAVDEGRPYALAFVDVRMPPGWDGIETTRQLWNVCPDLQIVICTAYSDCSLSEMQERIQPRDRLLILKKPFDTIEVLQLANALTEKWRMLQDSKTKLGDLNLMVRKRTQELEASQVAALNMMEDAVRNHEEVERAYENLKREVEERRKLEEQSREQASLLDKAQDAILVCDFDHHITYWNKSAESLYGWTAEEVVGQSVVDLIYRDPSSFEHARECLIEIGEWVGELEQIAREGRKLIVEGRWTLVRDAEGEPQSILAINTDITEKKKLEEQFLRAQRMESIGTLAGGIAHDLNNILSPIIMAVDLLRLTITDESNREILNTIADSARRGAEMVGQVLSFARGMEGRRVEVHLEHLIRDIEKIARDTFPKSIEIESKIARDLWLVSGDPTQLHQVLLNFCVNARDAMPDGGQITLTAQNTYFDAQYAAMNLEAKQGPHVAIQVEDTGCGIAESVIAQIFDPFFTTKEVGKGTGLGLSTSLAIIKSHGGFVRVSSELKAGTRFSLYLPAATDHSQVEEAPEEPELPRGNGEIILVVDDETAVRQITKQTLEAFGYRVILASDGAEAVALYAKHRADIAVILTDMMMPIMDGASAIGVLTRMNPDVRIIAASGITTNESIAKASGSGVRHFLPKPYTADMLLKALKQILLEQPLNPS